MNKRVFIDSDVILDLLQERPPFFNDSIEIFNLIETGKIEGFVSPLIFSNLFYILKKYKNEKFAFSSLLRLKLLLKVLPINEKTIDLALSSDFKDFEDAVQYYCALENKIPYIITRNVKDYKEKDLIILKPNEFLKYGKPKKK